MISGNRKIDQYMCQKASLMDQRNIRLDNVNRKRMNQAIFHPGTAEKDTETFKQELILTHYWQECKMAQPFWKTFGSFLDDPTIPLVAVYPRETTTHNLYKCYSLSSQQSAYSLDAEREVVRFTAVSPAPDTQSMGSINTH